MEAAIAAAATAVPTAATTGATKALVGCGVHTVVVNLELVVGVVIDGVVLLGGVVGVSEIGRAHV